MAPTTRTTMRQKRKSNKAILQQLAAAATALAQIADQMAQDGTTTEEDKTQSTKSPAPSRQSSNLCIETNSNRRTVSRTQSTKEKEKKRGGRVDAASVEGNRKDGKTKTPKVGRQESKSKRDAKVDRQESKSKRDAKVDRQESKSKKHDKQIHPVAQSEGYLRCDEDDVYGPENAECVKRKRVPLTQKESVGNIVELIKSPVVKKEPEFPDLYYEIGRTFGSTIVKYNKCRMVKYQEKDHVGNYQLRCTICHFVFLVKNFQPSQYGTKVDIVGKKGRPRCM